MAFDDAIGQTVLFGGFGFNLIRFADTWTWDGSDWAIHLGGSVKPSPHSGSPGESILVMGWGFAPGETVRLTWIDSGSGSTPLGSAQCDASGQLWARITVPAGASPGRQRIKAKGHSSGETAAHRFFVE
jgi:hypothetical protein